MTATPPGGDPFGQPVQPPPPGLPSGPPPGFSWAPPQAGDAESSRTKAVWALVLAILPLCLTWIAAAVLAIIVLVGPRDGQRRGRGMAWASIVVVVLWGLVSVVAAVAVIASVSADRDDDGDVTSSGEVFAQDLQVGDCLDEDFDFGQEGEETYTVTVTPCDQPHLGEAYHDLDLDAGDYPGETAIWDLADEACYIAFEPWVGESYERSEIDFTYYYPTEESWEQDDRAVTCVAIALEDTTGTLEGSGR